MRRVTSLAVAILAMASFASVVSAQYMFIDSNGDGVNTAGDWLNPTITNSVDIWLSTDLNRDATSPTCAAGPESLTINSYSFILHAVDGTVSWGGYTNLMTDFTLSFGQGTNNVDLYVGYGSGSALPPGTYHLGTVEVSVLSGSASLTFAQTTPLSGSALTCFGSRCAGVDGDHTLKLGIDWSDAFGLSSDEPTGISAPVSVRGQVGAPVTIWAELEGVKLQDSVTLSVSGNPQSLTLGEVQNGDGSRYAVLDGILETGAAGTYPIVWSASSHGTSASDTTILDVVEHNYPPVVSAPALVEASEGFPLTVNVSAVDPDGTPIDYMTADLNQLPAGNNASFTTSPNNSTGTLTWTPTATDAREYRVVFTAWSWSLDGSDTTTVRVKDYPWEILRVTMPGPGYHVVAATFDETCLGLCGSTEYVADDSSYVRIPLAACPNGGTCNWFDFVTVEMQYRNRAGYIAQPGSEDKNAEDVMEPSLTLAPESTPSDRLANYTPATDSYLTSILACIDSVRLFYLSRYKVVPAKAIRVFFGSGAPSANEENGIKLTDYNTLITTFGGLTWTMAHEYAHHVQFYVWGVFTTEYCDDLVRHSGCDEAVCHAGRFLEGMADAMADYYHAIRVAHIDTLASPLYIYRGDGTVASFANCPPGDYESNVSQLMYFMSWRDPVGMMRAYAVPKLVLGYYPVVKVPPRTLEEYWDLWNGVEPPDCEEVLSPSPGTWNASAFYRRAIMKSTTDVEIDAEAKEPSMRMRAQNPSNGTFDVAVTGPASGPLQIAVFNVTGRLVFHTTGRLVNGSAQVHVSLPSVAAGVYFVRVHSKEHAWELVKKIVIAR